MSAALNIIAQIDKLASLPAVYQQVKAVLDAPQGTIAQLAEVIAYDPAMSARLLKVVNSPFFGLRQQVASTSRALDILGMRQVHDAVLAWAVGQAFAGLKPHILDINTFWRGSVYRALAAQCLGKRVGFIDTGALFVEGLLSDIGELILYCTVPDQMAAVLEVHQQTKRPLLHLERDMIGCDKAQLGCALIKAWRLPESFEVPVAYQYAPCAARIHQMEAAIMHVSGALAGTSEAMALLQPCAIKLLELDDAALDEIRTLVSEKLGSVMAALFGRG